MGLGLERDDALDVLYLEVVSGRLVLGSELLNHGALGKSHIVLVCRQYLAGVLLGGLLYHRKQARFHLFAIDDEGTAENLVTAVFRVNLGEAKDF